MWVVGPQFDLVEVGEVRPFHVECQDNFYGGFAKYPDHLPDVLHAFYSVRGQQHHHDHGHMAGRQAGRQAVGDEGETEAGVLGGGPWWLRREWCVLVVIVMRMQVCFLSLSGEEGVRPLDPGLAVARDKSVRKGLARQPEKEEEQQKGRMVGADE